MTQIKCLFCAAVATLLTTPAHAQRTIIVEPGLWEYSHTLSIPGLLDPSEQRQTRCISSKEARRDLSDLLDELASGDANCTVSKLKDTLNTVKFDLACKPKVGAMEVTANGQAAFRYGRTRITGRTTGTVMLNGVAVPVNGTGQAKRIGMCKK
jgi:uncharacterized protein DUF3617